MPEALAEATQDPSARETYREVAQRWRQLAEHTEKNQHFLCSLLNGPRAPDSFANDFVQRW